MPIKQRNYANISVSLTGNWRVYCTGKIPYGSVAIGTVSLGSGDTGALLKTAVGFLKMNSTKLRPLPEKKVLAAIAAEAVSRLPQVTGQRGGQAGRGVSKVRGGSDHYRKIRAMRS